MALKVALQLYSVRREMAENLPETLKKVKEMGYEGVEFAGLGTTPPAAVKELCDNLGLTVVSAHVPYKDMLENPEKKFKTYKDIGCKYVVIPYLMPEDRPGTDGFARFIEVTKMLGRAAKDNGLTLLYHNHEFEFIKLDGKYGLDVLYDSVPAELLKTQIDTCWAAVGGVNPAEYVRKYTGRAPLVHLKDYFGESSESMYELIGLESKAPARPGNFEYRPLGSGMQSFPEIIAASEDAGAEWIVVEQDNPTPGLTPLECAEKSRNYLKTLGY